MTKDELNNLFDSIVTYRPNGGGSRTIRIDDVDANIKNGRAGFCGTIISSSLPNDEAGDDVWGYCDQLTDY